MTYAVGETVELSFTTSPAEVGTLVVLRPDGTTYSATVLGSAGAQTALVDADQLGAWSYTWTAPNAGAQPGTFTVAAPSGVTLANVKAALNKTDTADDDELRRLIAAAEVEYAERVAPLPGVQRQTGTGPVVILRSPRATSLTTVVDANGTTVTATLGEFGIVTTTAARAVTVTYVVPALPANHLETIVADVAGLFAATQRGTSTARPQFGGDGYAEPLTIAPSVLFPRIRALAYLDVR